MRGTIASILYDMFDEDILFKMNKVVKYINNDDKLYAHLTIVETMEVIDCVLHFALISRAERDNIMHTLVNLLKKVKPVYY
jgi:hypothetical protein